VFGLNVKLMRQALSNLVETNGRFVGGLWCKTVRREPKFTFAHELENSITARVSSIHGRLAYILGEVYAQVFESI